MENKRKTIIAMSDLHGNLPEVSECDIVCICGDIVPLYIQRNMPNSIAWLAGPFQEWALNLPCKKVVLTWGNHDFIGEYLMNNGTRPNEISPEGIYDGFYQHELLFQNDSDQKIVILCHESQTVEGINFFGTPFCPSLSRWAFYRDRMGLLKEFDKIPRNTQILITHCPPKYGMQGVVLQNNWNYMNDFGCLELFEVLSDHFVENDMWVLSGHIHSGNHRVETLGKIKHRNVSLLDEDYTISYEPFKFEF
jgi:Icc-related predicted phosphoesterase